MEKQVGGILREGMCGVVWCGVDGWMDGWGRGEKGQAVSRWTVLFLSCCFFIPLISGGDMGGGGTEGKIR
jgi:hypothetical protein